MRRYKSLIVIIISLIVLLLIAISIYLYKIIMIQLFLKMPNVLQKFTKVKRKASEKVNVVGENGGESQENPNIEWTFRRKIKEQTKKDDGSIVITITYNLPIDETKVPEGWSMIRDDDGAVRKITRTFKKNESYENDVPVYQNGTGKEVKTSVKLTAPVISKTGETTFFIIVAILVASAVAVITKRKIK